MSSQPPRRSSRHTANSVVPTNKSLPNKISAVDSAPTATKKALGTADQGTRDRSNRAAVIDYCTNLLPKWESWKAAEDIRDSVKFQIGDASASRRKRWNESGTMAAPEYPRLRFRETLHLRF